MILMSFFLLVLIALINRLHSVRAARRRLLIRNQSMRDHEVVRDIFTLHFPFLGSKCLELAFFRTFSIPSIAKLLHATGRTTATSDAFTRRYADTEIILREVLERDVTTNVRAKKAIKRLNEIHVSEPRSAEERRGAGVLSLNERD